MRPPRMIFVVAGALLILALALFALPILRSAGDSGNRPIIALSLDKTLWNRLGLSRVTYRRAVWKAGGAPRLLDYDDAGIQDVDREQIDRLLDGVHGLLLSGGGDVDPALYGGDPTTGLDVRPLRDRFEIALLEEAERRGLPILAICRGAQLLNVERGGTLRTLRQDSALRKRHRSWRRHPVELEPGSRLAAILGTTTVGRVVSWHGQAVEEPGDGIRIAGRAPDGVVEAIDVIEDGAPWVVGVQWHPEVARRDAQQIALFDSFVDAADRYRTEGANNGR